MQLYVYVVCLPSWHSHSGSVCTLCHKSASALFVAGKSKPRRLSMVWCMDKSNFHIDTVAESDKEWHRCSSRSEQLKLAGKMPRRPSRPAPSHQSCCVCVRVRISIMSPSRAQNQKLYTLYLRSLPCSAMHKRGPCHSAVLVCLSISCILSKHIFKFFHHRVAIPF